MAPASALAGCSARPWDWDDCLDDAAAAAWDGVKSAAAAAGGAAGEFAGWIAEGTIYIGGSAFVLAAQAIDRGLAAVGIDTALGEVVTAAVRRLASRVGSFVGSVVGAVLSDPKTFLLVVGAALSCGATALGAVVAAPACAATLEQATQRIITATIAETVENLVAPLIGEERAKILGGLVAKYKDAIAAGEIPAMPSMDDLERAADDLARRAIQAGTRALDSALGTYAAASTRAGLDYLAQLDPRRLAEAIPQPAAAIDYAAQRLRTTPAAIDAAQAGAALAVRSATQRAQRALAQGVNAGAALAEMRNGIDAAVRDAGAQLAAAAEATVLEVPEVADLAAELGRLGVRVDSQQLRNATRARIARAIADHPAMPLAELLDSLPVWSVLDGARVRAGLTLAQVVDAQAAQLYAQPALAQYRGASTAVRRAALLAAVDRSPPLPDNLSTAARAQLLAPLVADYMRGNNMNPNIPGAADRFDPTKLDRGFSLDPLRGASLADRVAAAQAKQAAAETKLPAWVLPAAAVAVVAFFALGRR